jgi:hypothetical protein
MMLPKRTNRKKMGTREGGPIRSTSHLRWIRGFGCCVCCMTDPHSQATPTEAAHVRTGTDGGMGMKPGDNYVIPLCSEHHAEQHRIGEASFQERYQFDMKATAEALWKKSTASKKVPA